MPAIAPPARLPGQKLSDAERYHVAALREAGYSYPRISKATGIPESTVVNNLQRVERGEIDLDAAILESTKKHLLAGAARGAFRYLEEVNRDLDDPAKMGKMSPDRKVWSFGVLADKVLPREQAQQAHSGIAATELVSALSPGTTIRRTTVEEIVTPATTSSADPAIQQEPPR